MQPKKSRSPSTGLVILTHNIFNELRKISQQREYVDLGAWTTVDKDKELLSSVEYKETT